MFRIVPAVLCAALLAATPGLAQDTAKADAASMRTKLEAIARRGESAVPRPAAPLRTAFTDREVNAYFQVDGPLFLPSGVSEARLTIEPAGRVRARAMVKLDDALQTKQRSWLDPLAWVTGTYEVTAMGTLQAANGTGRLTIENATVGGVTIPPSVLQQVVGYYSRTPDTPGGFSLDKPFDLPSRIQAVQTERGRATIVQ
jgi:hypothetical protein